jgi:ABC-type transport system involved in cytochrome c biogenesis permease subunit
MDIYEAGVLMLAAATVSGWGATGRVSLVHAGSHRAQPDRHRRCTGIHSPTPMNASCWSYLVSSQSAVMWMSALYVMATVAYFAHLFSGSAFVGKVASAMTWSATAMGLVGLMVRWRETYLVGHDVGYIPVSNLYEVFILFAIITAMIYLYYEGRYRTRSMGAFVLLVISAAVGFLLWYSFDRGAHEIQPLVPAPAKLLDEDPRAGQFRRLRLLRLSAMLGVAYLIAARATARQHPGQAHARPGSAR